MLSTETSKQTISLFFLTAVIIILICLSSLSVDNTLKKNQPCVPCFDGGSPTIRTNTIKKATCVNNNTIKEGTLTDGGELFLFEVARGCQGKFGKDGALTIGFVNNSLTTQIVSKTVTKTDPSHLSVHVQLNTTILGPPGPQGPQGPIGGEGIMGIKGVDGPQGPRGITKSAAKVSGFLTAPLKTTINIPIPTGASEMHYTIVGGGGGGGGGSCDVFFLKLGGGAGGGGGSGYRQVGMIPLKDVFSITVKLGNGGEGGVSGLHFLAKEGRDGTPTLLNVNNVLYDAAAGGNGGGAGREKKGGTGGDGGYGGGGGGQTLDGQSQWGDSDDSDVGGGFQAGYQNNGGPGAGFNAGAGGLGDLNSGRTGGGGGGGGPLTGAGGNGGIYVSEQQYVQGGDGKFGGGGGGSQGYNSGVINDPGGTGGFGYIQYSFF